MSMHLLIGTISQVITMRHARSFLACVYILMQQAKCCTSRAVDCIVFVECCKSDLADRDTLEEASAIAIAALLS